MEFWRDLKLWSLRLFNKAMHVNKFTSTFSMSKIHLTILTIHLAVIRRGSAVEQ